MQTTYAPGEFCWAELMTTAAGPAAAFYGRLFGWSAVAAPFSDGVEYSLWRRAGGGDAGGLYQMTDSLVAQRVPPHWSSFVAVADADEAAERVRRLGGGVVSEPFMVGEAGRMAIVQDPTGALINVWQAGERKGAARGRPFAGRPCWHELMTRDLDAAAAFYREWLGWTSVATEDGDMRYTVMAMPSGALVAAMMQVPAAWQRIPSHWLPYFGVDDTAEVAALARANGGAVLTPPTEVEGRERFAILRDPQSVTFGVMEARRTDA